MTYPLQLLMNCFFISLPLYLRDEERFWYLWAFLFLKKYVMPFFHVRMSSIGNGMLCQECEETFG